MVIYLVKEEALKYKGKVKWIRISNLYANENDIRKIFEKLYERESFLGLLYDPDEKVLLLYFIPSLIAWLPIVIGLSSFIGGMIIQGVIMKRAEEGIGEWDIRNPPGYSIGFWDILKFGILSLVIAFIVKIGVDAYVAIRKVEYMPSPYQVIEPYVREAYKVGREIVERIK